jgi:hypothetical protein
MDGMGAAAGAGAGGLTHCEYADLCLLGGGSKVAIVCSVD